jgi:hypothetical protein
MTKTVIRLSRHIPSVLQQSLDFSDGPRISLSVEHPGERTVMRAAFVLIAVLICGYLYFVSSSVLNVIARKEALMRIDSMQNSISAMQQEYFALSEGVTPSEGVHLGLAPVDSTSYMYLPGNTAAVTMRGTTEL